MHAYIYILFFSVLLSRTDLHSSFTKDYSSSFLNSSIPKLSNSDSKTTVNPLKSVLFSAILPGSGQMLNGDFKRGTVYMAIELLSWVYRDNYISKSKFYENKYKEFANEHWSFDKWIRDYSLFGDPGNSVHSTMIDSYGNFAYPWDDAHGIEFTHDGGSLNKTTDVWFKAQYESYCSDAMQDYTIQCDTDFFSSERVVVNKDHHLYEGLGKYELFFAGWDDTEDCDDSVINEHGTCSYILSVGNKQNAFTENKRYYQYELRSKANKKSDYAENALTLIFANHAISMFDAFISNVIKNKDMNFNYYSHPIYNNSSGFTLEGINFSILW